jgi:formylglycine-generating enzyme required for sulfatase activity
VRQALYACPGYRLPTEAEREHAYRAGTTTAYYNGDNDPKECQSCITVDTRADAIAWYCYNSEGKVHQVGKKKANARGLYDMAGNVAEWCHDWYAPSLGSAPLTDPVGGNPQSGERVFRGGSWRFNPALLRAGSRSGTSPTNRKNSLGFRCARVRPPAS